MSFQDIIALFTELGHEVCSIQGMEQIEEGICYSLWNEPVYISDAFSNGTNDASRMNRNHVER